MKMTSVTSIEIFHVKRDYAMISRWECNLTMMQTIHQLTFEHLVFFFSVYWRKWHSIDSKFLFQFRVSFLRRWWWKAAKSDVLKHVYSRHSETIFWCSCSALRYYTKPFWGGCLVDGRRNTHTLYLYCSSISEH
jgi:hypothetical protein